MSYHPIMPYGEGHHRSDRVLLHKGEPFTYTPERAAQLEEIVGSEVDEFVARVRGASQAPVELALRMRFNPNLEHSWFGSLMEIINMVTMLSIVLTGASLLREREHGTIEHLLVMPVTPAEASRLTPMARN